MNEYPSPHRTPQRLDAVACTQCIFNEAKVWNILEKWWLLFLFPLLPIFQRKKTRETNTEPSIPRPPPPVFTHIDYMWFASVRKGLHPHTVHRKQKCPDLWGSNFDDRDRDTGSSQNVKESNLQPKFQFHCFSDVSWQGRSEVVFVPKREDLSEFRTCQHKPSFLPSYFLL